MLHFVCVPHFCPPNSIEKFVVTSLLNVNYVENNEENLLLLDLRLLECAMYISNFLLFRVAPTEFDSEA